MAFDVDRADFAELVRIMADSPQRSWSAAELVELADRNELLIHRVGKGSKKSKQTRMGILASRFVKDWFKLDGGHTAIFHLDKYGNNVPVSTKRVEV